MARRMPGFDPPGDVPEPAPAELAAAATAIAEEFPLVLDQTSLVLLDLDPGHLHAFWVLASEDLHRAHAVFRPVGGTPELVIRLLRLHPDGGAEILNRVVQPEGTKGDARFDLENDDSTYQAELGLSASDGGWILLARSNPARLPRAVGTPIPHWTSETPSEPAAVGRANAPLLALVPGVGIDAEQASAPALEPSVTRSPIESLSPFPGVPFTDDRTQPSAARSPEGNLPQARPPDPGTRPARWVLATAARGKILTDRDPAESDWPVALNLDTGSKLASEGEAPALDRSWQPAIRIDWPWSEPVPPVAKAAPAVAYTPSTQPWTAPLADNPVQASAVAAPNQVSDPEPPGPISSFALGRGPEAAVIEAEVLVHISARPGTLVDLYGRPVRVGPSGRSTLRLPVTDLTLLTALLELPADDV